MTDVQRVRSLTGITVDQIPDDDLAELIELYDGQVFCAAAEAADRMGTRSIATAGVTAVEDITMDRRRVVESWTSLADRLRARCERDEAEVWDDGPTVVEFHPWGHRAPEAVERHA